MKSTRMDQWECTVSFVSNESYSTDLFIHKLESLITDYKVVNFTQAKLNEVISRCRTIKLEIKRRNTFYLLKKADQWLVCDLKYEIDSSKLTLEDCDY